MPATSAQRVGLTPYHLRLASYYASLGVGEYEPKGYSQFDKVVVKQLLPWKPDEEQPTRSCLILIVEFMVKGHRSRYVEFALTPAGWGGDPLLRVLPGAHVESQGEAAADE